jgi:adenine-specific DNA-methyltransferase
MADIESLQEAHCLDKDREYRRAAGQFFTPRWIAKGMARWVVAAAPSRIIDPAAGFGILLDECLRQGFKGSLIGYEIDSEVVRRWTRDHEKTAAIELRELDFLDSPDEPVEAAVVNPPYNRFQHRDLPPRLQLQLARALGELASGYTNQYALFLYVILSRLVAGGRAAFIVPSEFLATGYGVQVKKFLIQSRRLRHLVIFDTATRVFADAMTTACVLLFDGGKCNALDVWHLQGEAEAEAFVSLCSGAAGASGATSVPYIELEPSQNWQGLGLEQADRSGFVPLGTYGDVKRGIATGANEFFVLRPSEALQWGLSEDELVRCISSASAVPDIVFTERHFAALAEEDKAVYLFDGCAGEAASSLRYIAHGEDQEFHLRYLTRMRRPWYRLESRRPAPLLLAVFGRDGFRVAMNSSSAVNLTAFHGFYPKAGAEQLVELIWLYFQTSTARSAYVGQQRAYGDGLKKLEPGDWSKLHVPDWQRWDSASLAKGASLAAQALKQVMAGASACPPSLLLEFESLIESGRRGAADHRKVPIAGEQISLI